jgi:hypothetical protein
MTRESIDRSRSVGEDRSLTEELPRTLYYAARQVIEDEVQIALGSSGGPRYGAALLKMAFERVQARLHRLPDYPGVPPQREWDAFLFGGGLHDAERLLGE